MSTVFALFGPLDLIHNHSEECCRATPNRGWSRYISIGHAHIRVNMPNQAIDTRSQYPYKQPNCEAQ